MKRAAGFTMIELVLVMVLVGVLAAIGIPRLLGDDTMAAAAFGEEVVGALRTAQKAAVARRRLVCAAVDSKAVTLSMAPEPGADCTIPLGQEAYYTSAGGVTASPRALFFQPNGLITLDAAGSTPVRGTIDISVDGKQRRSIRYEGNTGHVQ